MPTADANTIDTTGPQPREDELMQVISAYNRVTERLEASHERLTAEVQRLHSELASANAALQRSRRLAALGEMAAGIAHEVRNPLASIRLYARMLCEDLADRPEPRHTAEKIGLAVRGLDAIVHDVLTFSRDIRVHTMPGPARQLLETAADAAGDAIGSARVELSITTDPEGLQIDHDADLMHRALLNLIRNAAQAMAGAPTRRLTLRADEAGGQSRIVVVDTGPGIAPDAIDRIFNPFFTTRDSGTGLGLAIVHRIVEAHGGTIDVANDAEHGGAVFTLRLPRAAEHGDPRSRSDET